jgi:hypothetical protein
MAKWLGWADAWVGVWMRGGWLIGASKNAASCRNDRSLPLIAAITAMATALAWRKRQENCEAHR